MKTLLFVAALSVSAAALADTYVSPYVRSDGTYVEGHYRSSPNGNPYDNYSARGNTNPYTGERGSHNPNYDTQRSRSYDTPPFPSDRDLLRQRGR